MTTEAVTVGVDTHSDTHHAAVIDAVGRPLADAGFPTTPPAMRSCWPGLEIMGR